LFDGTNLPCLSGQFVTMHPVYFAIAQVARTDPTLMSGGTRLDQLGLNSSVGLSVFRSALERRFQKRLRPLSWQMTVEEVVAMIDGDLGV